MANANPLQRQKRTSFLLGFFTMFLIAAIIIGFLGFTIINMKKAEQEKIAAMQEVYVVTKELKSGSEINYDSIVLQTIDGDLAPSNKFTTEHLMTEQDGKKVERKDLVARINLQPGTILTADMVAANTENLGSDVRKQEYNMVTMPTEIKSGDFIDIRIRFTTGVDYIIVAKKQITIPKIAGMDSVENFSVDLSEDETIAMSSAIIDAYSCPGSEIYMTIYTTPGMQVAATPTYPVTEAAINFIRANPNAVDQAKQALTARYNQNRTTVQNEVNSNSEDAKDNIEAKVDSHITKRKEYKQQYLEDLAGSTN